MAGYPTRIDEFLPDRGEAKQETEIQRETTTSYPCPLRLQTGAVDDLHVDSHLAAVIGDDQDADRAAARLEGLLEAAPEVALVDDRQVLLDIAGLGHGNDGAIIAHVEDAVLLEDRSKHRLDDDARGRVGDEGGLLMELLGEEVNTQVAVLASGSRGRDADDLAGAALEDQDVAEADVVARDGDGVGWAGSLARGGSATGLTDLNAGSVAFMMGDLVSQLVQTLLQTIAEGVVAAWGRGAGVSMILTRSWGGVC